MELILSMDELIANSRIEMNVSDDLRDVMAYAQEIQLKDFLGETLYQQVLDAIYRGGTIEDELLYLVKRYLTYLTLMDYCKVNHYRLTNKGVMKLNDTSGADVDWYVTYYANTMESYKRRLSKYINTEVDTIRGIYLDVDKNNYYE